MSRSPPIETESWCYTQVSEDKEFTYAWTIEKFRKIIDNLPPGKTMYSEQFVVPLTDRSTIWRLKVYPNGRSPGDAGNMTVFLKDSGRQEPAMVKALVTFSIINGRGEKTHEKTVNKEYKVPHHAFGFSKFARHIDLFNPTTELLPGGSLTIHCKIVVQGIETSTITSPLLSHKGKTSVDVSKIGVFKGHMLLMLKSPEEFASDVKILCRDGVLSCHSCILAARSPVFKAMFTHPTTENETGSIQLEDTDKSTMNKLLQYLYTGELCPELVNVDLLIVADKYDVQDLKVLCEEQLVKRLIMKNCVELLIVGDRHNAAELKRVAKAFIVSHSSHFLGVPDWKRKLLPFPNLLTEILEDVISSPPPAKRRRIENLSPVSLSPPVVRIE